LYSDIFAQAVGPTKISNFNNILIVVHVHLISILALLNGPLTKVLLLSYCDYPDNDAVYLIRRKKPLTSTPLDRLHVLAL
jgi:hypothetical protein